ncbi:MAG: phosphosulfolactate synthase [Candidatus Zixiibacteriota bacterium]|nr:MAG: phosphosulfolactate synthase [candidate division Zixibacteria bacterium]
MPKREGSSKAKGRQASAGAHHTWDYLRMIGVPDLPPRTSPFDPGYDPLTLESHLEQSSHLISVLKISMACWQVASEKATRRKVQAARKLNVPVCTGGGPFEVAVTFGKLGEFLDLCADIGVTRIEAGEGFTDTHLDPNHIVKMAADRGLEVQFEVGKKHGGSFGDKIVQELIDQGQRWLDAGAKDIVIEGRESAESVGVFDAKGNMNAKLAERFASAYGLERTVFEAPDKPSQFAFLNHFGPEVHLSNVRIEELLRVEIYRRGLHSDAFQYHNLRPKGPKD